MKSFKVYLAGPITGQTYSGATDWRDYATRKLASVTSPYAHKESTSIYAYSPMRAKGYLKELEAMPDSMKDKPLSTVEAILNRDHYDCYSSDAILVNLLETDRVSIGTVMEIAWAYAYRKPTVLVTTEENIHRHGMIVASVGWHTSDLDEGIQMIKDILLP